MHAFGLQLQDLGAGKIDAMAEWSKAIDSNLMLDIYYLRMRRFKSCSRRKYTCLLMCSMFLDLTLRFQRLHDFRVIRMRDPG